MGVFNGDSIYNSGNSNDSPIDGVYVLLDYPSDDFGENEDFAIVLIYYGLDDLGTIIPPQSDDANCSASSVKPYGEGGNWFPYYAFDDNLNTSWSSNNYVTAAWLQYDFGENNEKKITTISILPRNYAGLNQIGKFEVQSSNNGFDWTTLMQEREIPSNNLNHWFSYVFENDNYYRYYRLNVLSTNGQTITLKEVHFNTSGSITSKHLTTQIFKKISGHWVRQS